MHNTIPETDYVQKIIYVKSVHLGVITLYFLFLAFLVFFFNFFEDVTTALPLFERKSLTLLSHTCLGIVILVANEKIINVFSIFKLFTGLKICHQYFITRINHHLIAAVVNLLFPPQNIFVKEKTYKDHT